MPDLDYYPVSGGRQSRSVEGIDAICRELACMRGDLRALRLRDGSAIVWACDHGRQNALLSYRSQNHSSARPVIYGDGFVVGDSGLLSALAMNRTFEIPALLLAGASGAGGSVLVGEQPRGPRGRYGFKQRRTYADLPPVSACIQMEPEDATRTVGAFGVGGVFGALGLYSAAMWLSSVDYRVALASLMAGFAFAFGVGYTLGVRS